MKTIIAIVTSACGLAVPTVTHFRHHEPERQEVAYQRPAYAGADSYRRDGGYDRGSRDVRVVVERRDVQRVQRCEPVVRCEPTPRCEPVTRCEPRPRHDRDDHDGRRDRRGR